MGLFQRLFGKAEEPTAPVATSSEFSVGERVRDSFGSTGTITMIDPSAEHGLGLVVVKMDDGRESKLALVASGLERVG